MELPDAYDRHVRWIAVLALALGCGRIGFDAGPTCTYAGKTYPSGDTFAAGDGCNSCTCLDGNVTCSSQSCPDANPMSCEPSGGCPSGPACGGAGVCCGVGEACVNGVCMCAIGAACTGGAHCAVCAGTPPPLACGQICTTGPCPGVNP